MPIEIRELHIQIDLKPPAGEESASAADSNGHPAANREELMNEIAEMISRQLEVHKER